MSISWNCEKSTFNVFDLPRGNIEFSYFFLFSTFSCQIKKRVLKKVVIESNRYQRVTKESIKSFLRIIKKSIKSRQFFSESSKSQQRVVKESESSICLHRLIKESTKGSKKSHQIFIKKLHDLRFLLFAKY